MDVRILHCRFVWDGGPMHVDGTVSEGDVLPASRSSAFPGHAPGRIGL